jgi:hypothetical protein
MRAWTARLSCMLDRNSVLKIKINGATVSVFYSPRMWSSSGPLSPGHGASSGCGWRNGLLLWRLTPNTLNKQSRAADKGWPSSLGVGRGANKSSP